METAPIQLDCNCRMVMHAITEVKVLQNARKGTVAKATSWDADVIDAMLVIPSRVVPRGGSTNMVGTGGRYAKGVLFKKVSQVGRICSGLESRAKDMKLITGPRVRIGIKKHIQMSTERAESC